MPKFANALPHADVSQTSTKDVLLIKLADLTSCACPVAIGTPPYTIVAFITQCSSVHCIISVTSECSG